MTIWLPPPGTGAVMVRVSGAASVPWALLAPMVRTLLPTLLGVPLMTPVAEAKVNPLGRAEQVNAVGEFEAVIA